MIGLSLKRKILHSTNLPQLTPINKPTSLQTYSTLPTFEIQITQKNIAKSTTIAI